MSEWQKYWEALNERQQSMCGMTLANQCITQLEAENESYLRLDEEGYASLAVQLVDAENENATLKQENETMKAWMFGHGCLERYNKVALLTAEESE